VDSGQWTAVLLFLSSILYPLSFVIAGDVGSTAAQYLKIALNPRNEGMGGSGVADMSDEIFYNPASIAQIENPSARMGYVAWFEDMTKANVFTVKPLINSRLKIAANLSYFIIDGLKSYADDAVGTELGDFKRNSTDLSIAAAIDLGSLAVGLTVKGINEKYDSVSGQTFAADMGAIMRLTRTISLGASLINTGGKLEIGTVEKPLPTTTRVGICIKPNDRFTVNYDMDMPNDDDTRQHTGAEWEFRNNYYLRAGLQSFGEISGMTFGFGMKVNADTMQKTISSLSGSSDEKIINIDYSYQANSEFDNIHRFSIGIDF